MQDDETGHIYSVGDVMRLRALLKQLVLNTDLRQRMGEAAQERIKHWNYDTCVTEIVRAVAEVAQ